MKKRILSLLLVMIMVFTLIPVYSMADTGKADTQGADIKDIVGTIKDLIGNGGSGDISDIIGGLDKDQLIDVIKGLIGDDSNIGDIIGSLDTDQLIEIIKGLINGGDIDIDSILEGLDKDQLIEILKGLIGDDSNIGDILGELDIDKLIEIIKGLINGDLDFESLIKDLDPVLILKLISALFGSDLDIEGPSNVTVTEGQDASFSVKVNLSLVDQLKGIEYSYIWIEPSSLKDIDFGSGKVDMVAIIKTILSKALSTEDTLVIENASMNDSGRQFVCIVYNLSEKMFEKGQEKPILVGEFHFGCYDRGMFKPGLAPVWNQAERARSYTRFVEGCLAHPLIVGCHWFQYRDQPLLGRGDGEAYQIGFVDVCDRPYPELTRAARKLGKELYEKRVKGVW